MPAQEVGHVEGRHVAIGQLLETADPLVECEAMRPGKALHAVLFAHSVQHPAGAAIGIAD